MITIYKTKNCPYCVMVKQLCDRAKANYEVIEMDDNPSLRQMLIAKTGFMTVPITTNGSQYIAGWQPYKLMELIKNDAS